MIDYSFNSSWVEQYESLANFISNWFDIEKCLSDIKLDKNILPLSLLQFYKDYGNSINKIFTFNKFAQYEEYRKNQKHTFLAENQGVYIWKVQTLEDNPTVLISENSKPYSWEAEEEKLCGFIYQMVVFEALMTSKYSLVNYWIDRKNIENILRNWIETAFKPMKWPAYPAKFYYNDDAIAFVFPNEDGYVFQCGSNVYEKLAFMQEFIDDSWEVQTI